MQDQETVVPEQQFEEQQVEVSEPTAEQPQEAQEVEQEETTVPLHALQKERRKRQELEYELRMEREQKQRAAEPDESQYESATKGDLTTTKSAIKREIQEETWARQNPDQYQKINDDLPEFLKLRPNLASAIEASTNRYEEAWTLMNALSPKQKQQVQAKPKPQAPGSPASIPKAASLNESVDLMNMSDTEFNSWRQQKRGRR